MNKYNSKILTFLLILIPFIVTSCATKVPVGYGTITHVRKVKNENGSSKSQALQGAGVGIGIGAGSGALIGGVAVAGALAPFGLFIPAVVAGGMLAGAGVGAGMGAGIGAGIGSTKTLYQYSVKINNKPDTITIAQFEKNPLSSKTRVEVLSDGKQYYLNGAA